MDTVTHENADLVDKAARSAAELHAQADALLGETRAYRIAA